MAIPQLLLSDSKAARNVKEGGELMGIDMVMVHEKVSSIELPHLDLIRQSLRRKRRKTWQEVLILLNIEGCVTVWRDYHGDVFAAQAERFFSKLIEKEYALLDEMTDFGYPQYMEARILNEFIKTDVYRMEVTQRPPMAVTSSLLKEIRDTIQ
ncbi:PREDICTED: AP-1 complex subunit mu-2-like [Brassica oleracea var. oleracea]|uniref:AP-1 complex subunit mu-2-like n=1 Tax=Brassica oleracea var. oleracea TaxID=109376 RepID=UPI0006A6A22B|nr:PREDICTED: AP-1 complex subunit mu-2-like [Brassica oleracea var. oleracea]